MSRHNRIMVKKSATFFFVLAGRYEILWPLVRKTVIMTGVSNRQEGIFQSPGGKRGYIRLVNSIPWKHARDSWTVNRVSTAPVLYVNDEWSFQWRTYDIRTHTWDYAGKVGCECFQIFRQTVPFFSSTLSSVTQSQ